MASARAKGLGEDRLIVIHAAANKQHIYRRLQPKGLRKRHDYETARVELAVAEIVRKEKPAKKKAEKPKPAEPKEAKQ
jgi:ribosomal protein L22